MPVANLSRRTLTLALAFAPTGLRGGTEPCPPLPKVLFVCPAGSVKSAIARETLKSRAARLGIRVQIQSRGLVPEDHVSPALAAKLTADGINPGAEALRALSSEDVAAATIVVAFDDAAADPRLRQARPWTSPSWNADYPGAKAALAARRDTLLDELAGRSPTGCERKAR